MNSIKNLLLLLVVFIVSISCDNNANNQEEEHAEPVGFFLRESGQVLVTYQNAVVTGQITVQAGTETGLISAVFIDEGGNEFTPVGDEFTLHLTTTSEHFEFVQHEEDGKWKFHIAGKTVGSGSFILEIYHHDHSDFLSKAIPVEVSAAAN
jgi:hypothetical protein